MYYIPSMDYTSIGSLLDRGRKIKILQAPFVQEKFSFQVYPQYFEAEGTWSSVAEWYISAVNNKKYEKWAAVVKSWLALVQSESKLC